MSDINKMYNSYDVKQEVIEDEPHTNKETFILPDNTEISDIGIKQELADGEGINKETDDQLQPSCSRNTTQSEGERAHICNICAKSFSRSGHVNVHIHTVHEGKRAHVCNICDKTFAQSSNLKHHIKTVHEGYRAHSCLVCDKSFGTRGQLKTHIKTVP